MTLKIRFFTLFISIVMLFSMVVPVCAAETQPSAPDTEQTTGEQNPEDPETEEPTEPMPEDLETEEPTEPMPEDPETEEPTEPMPEDPETEEPTEPMPGAPETEEPTEPTPEDPETEELPLLEDALYIRVDIQCSGQIILNPYGLTIPVDYQERNDLIIGPTEMIINSSELALRVDVRVIGSFAPDSDAFFVDSVEDIVDGDKSMFLYLEIQNAYGNPYDTDWIGAFVDYDNQILVGSEENFRQNMLILEAGHEQETYAVFRFFGELSQMTHTGWTDNDNPHVTVVFTFVPLDENGVEIVFGEEPSEEEEFVVPEEPVNSTEEIPEDPVDDTEEISEEPMDSIGNIPEEDENPMSPDVEIT